MGNTESVEGGCFCGAVHYSARLRSRSLGRYHGARETLLFENLSLRKEKTYLHPMRSINAACDKGGS